MAVLLNNSDMNPIKILILCLLAIPALGILIFGPRADDELPRDRVIVDYWEKWTGDEATQMKQIVDEFNRTVGAEKKIYVRYVSTSSISQKTLVSTAAGVPPDIAGLWNENIVQYAATDGLEPLEDLAAQYTDYRIDQNYYKPVYWNACNYNGHLYALVSTPASIALHYNKDVIRQNADKLRAAGYDPEKIPGSLQELDEWGKIMTITDSDGTLKQAGYLPAEPGWYLNYTYLWFGGSIWDEKNQKFTFDNPGVMKSFYWVKSYTDRLGKQAISSFKSGLGNFDSPQNAFLAGTVIMEQQGPWMGNYIYNLKPSMSEVKWKRSIEMTKPLKQRYDNYSWGVAGFPSAVPGLEDVTYAPFDAFVIPRGAKHKKEAFEFIAYVNRQDVMEKINKLHCKNSPLANVSEDFLNNHDNPYIGVFEKLARSPNAHGVPQIPIWPEVASEINAIYQDIINQREPDIEGRAKKVQARLQAKYDLFMSRQAARKEAAK